MGQKVTQIKTVTRFSLATPYVWRIQMETNAKGVTFTLKLLYGLVPIAAGLDKFTNLLVDWQIYVPELAKDLLPVAPSTFMGVVGVVEITAGVLVLSKWTKIGALIVAVWLLSVALNLLVAGYYDVAVRDIAMAVGAWSLHRLAEPAYVTAGVSRTAAA